MKPPVLKPLSLLVAMLLFASTPVRADWSGLLDSLKSTLSGTGSGTLQQGEVVRGLKEALSKGTSYAVSTLGRSGGFLDNPQVRIPLPKSLQRVEQALRLMGQGRLADEFVATMNHAAEQAVPEAAGVFANAISHMTVNDAMGILKGPDDAATRYFERTAGPELVQKMRPIVAQATSRAGVTASYKRLIGGVPFAGDLVKNSDLNLDSYVTDKAVGGLFKMIAVEEKRIRENPAARTTELLRKVFGGA